MVRPFNLLFIDVVLLSFLTLSGDAVEATVDILDDESELPFFPTVWVRILTAVSRSERGRSREHRGDQKKKEIVMIERNVGYAQVVKSEEDVLEVELSSLVDGEGDETEERGEDTSRTYAEREERNVILSKKGLAMYAISVSVCFLVVFIALLVVLNQGEGVCTSCPTSSDGIPGRASATTPSPVDDDDDDDFTTTTSPDTSPSSELDCASHDHQISSLPGFGDVPSCQYAGTLSAGTGRNMFYWLVEAEGGYEDKPLIVWFNGGPLCSSLLGLFTENGPFVVTENPTSASSALLRNPYSWHSVASVLYVETPAAIGFGSDTTNEAPNDSNFATSTRAFLDSFMNAHARFQHVDDVWLSGESYAGHYITKLAVEMLAHVDSSLISSKLRGYMLGNGVIDDSWKYDGGSPYRALYKHDFISDETYEAMTSHCADTCNPYHNFLADCPQCSAARNKAKTEAGLPTHISTYDLYGDVCAGSSLRRSLTSVLEQHRVTRGGSVEKDSSDDGSIASDLHHRHDRVLIGGASDACEERVLKLLQSGCIQDHLQTYLRRSDVRHAIGVSRSNWNFCDDYTIRYGYTASVLDEYRNTLLESNLKILIYSGSVDDSVPTDGTRAWIRTLREENHLTYQHKWKGWYVNEQTAGYVETYNDGKFTFATVRGAGHMVPATQPERALAMVSRFVTAGAI